MPDADVVTFTLLVTLLTITPGADTLVLFRNVLRGGTRTGVATAVGGRFGLVIHATLSGLGVSAILAHSATAYHALRILGACYLVCIGVKSLAAATNPTDGAVNPTGHGQGQRPRPFREGVLSNLLNPKTALFYLAVLPQFVGPNSNLVAQSLLLCAIHVVVSMVWYVGLSVFLGGARRFLSKRSTVHRLLDAVSGVFLTALGIRLGLGER